MPGISGPGVRVYPFTHHDVGYGFLLERDGGKDLLFLAPFPTTADATLQCLIASWLHTSPGEPFPFVYFVSETDTATVKAMGGLKALCGNIRPKNFLFSPATSQRLKFLKPSTT